MTIIEILEQFDIPYRMQGETHHATSSFAQVDCCYCSPNSNRWRMGISLQGFTCLCWTCGQHSFFDTLKELTGLPSHEVIKLKSGIDSTYRERKVKHKGKLILPKGLAPMLSCHKKYLRGRGFDPEKLERLWGIQGIGLASKLAWRLFIPVFQQGEMVSWTTRSIVDEGVRYINAPPESEAVPLKDCVGGIDYARHSIIVTEGPLDAMNLGPGAVCTYGVNVTSAQINLLRHFPMRTVCFDSEPSAQKRSRDLCRELSLHPGRTLNLINEYEGKDPGSFSPESIADLRRKYLDD